jgi:chemotaxis protein MotB
MGAPKIDDSKHASPAVDHSHDDIMEHPAKKGEEGEGPWLVSYADLMTLLMGFFALISSMSVPDKQKMEKVKESAIEAIGGKYEKPYEGLSQALQKFIIENDLQSVVVIKRTAQGVEMTFTGSLFFESGDFIVKEPAANLMDKLASVIKKEPTAYKVLIEGHTDSVPISHPIISSNWELSGVRASRIAQIFEGAGFQKSNLTIIGWGDTRPATAEIDPSGQVIPDSRAKNRRVVLRVYDSTISDDPVRPPPVE